MLETLETPLAEIQPRLVVENRAVELVLPEDLEFLASCVGGGAGKPQAWRPAVRGLGDFLDQPASGADAQHLADAGIAFGKVSVVDSFIPSNGFHD